MQTVRILGKDYTVSIDRVEHKTIRDPYTVYTICSNEEINAYYMYCFDSGKRAFKRGDGWGSYYCDAKNDQPYIKALKSLVD